MLDAVIAGLGIGVLLCFLARDTPNVVCVETIGPPAPEVIWLVTHPDTSAIERVRVVTAWLLELFADKAGVLAPGARSRRRR
jgi:DNA-binding transcriptional LysR family regulator